MNKNETPILSNRARLQLVYQEIIDTVPAGALMFLITNNGELQNNTLGSRLFRKWQGFSSSDFSKWHTAVYFGPKKESKGGRWRPQIVHAHEKGTTIDLIPPEYFNDTDEGERTKKNRIELLIDPKSTPEQRQEIVDYCLLKVGLPFDGDPGWRREWPTYLLGVRSKAINPKETSCHGLAYEAYSLHDWLYPHQLQSAPNLLGRIFGHPLGHPLNHVNLRYLYLRDHHLYRNPHLKVILTAFEGRAISSARENEEYLPKYSWDPALQQAYGLLAVE
jgi:hypothetical protein